MSSDEDAPRRETADGHDGGDDSTVDGDFVDSFMDSIVPDAHPETVGRYKIIEILGEGGMGVVYLAEQSGELRRRVALKLIKPGMDSRHILARFDGERQALALMNHPNIARVHDAGVSEGGRPYFVMEHVKGIPLTEYCDHNRLDVAARLKLFVQVCQGVQHAHYKGIIHRDLKPSNVLVATAAGDEPVIKIIDFGVAKATKQRLTEATLLTEIGQILGTPGYMSPEQAEITTDDIDSRSDIYSLGVVLYELLIGVLPFDMEELRQSGFEGLLRTIREEDPLTPSTRLGRLTGASLEVAKSRSSEVRTLRKELRGDLDWITMKAMSKSRDERYVSALEFSEDIVRHLEHRPVLASPPGFVYRARKLVRRHRTKVGAVALALVILAGAGVVSYLDRLESARSAFARLEPAQKTFRSRLHQLNEHRSAWKDIRDSSANWTPLWGRDKEVDAYRLFRESEAQVTDALLAVGRDHQSTVELAPFGSDLPERARKEYAAFNRRMSEVAEKQGSLELTPDYFKDLARVLAPEDYDLDQGSVAFLSDPAGAEVFCFRYEERDLRLVPLPVDLSTGEIAAEPLLEVERVWDAQLSPFRKGDQILAVGGKPVTLESQFARVVQTIAADDSVSVRIRRGDREEIVDWVPFESVFYDTERAYRRRLAVGKVQSIREQFGFTFRAYRLIFRDEARLGETSAEPLSKRLRAGSYLFVFRKPGYETARYPVAVPPIARRLVSLLPEGEIPEGYVYIPAGPAQLGDARAYQSFDYGEEECDAFLIGAHEVTIGEYLEFVNSGWHSLDDDGRAEPHREDVAKEVDDYRGRVDVIEDGCIQIVPKTDSAEGVLLFRDEAGTWLSIEGRMLGPSSDWPILGVSHFAAMEYARWLSAREGRNYRLPHDIEWEKAARGVDRRPYVWGDYPLWNFAWTYKGSQHRLKSSGRVGISPADESVYGVRDLAGSVSELTVNRTLPRRYRYRSVRGASWWITSEEYDRVASRNSRNPERTGINTGFRLVIDLSEPESKSEENVTD